MKLATDRRYSHRQFWEVPIRMLGTPLFQARPDKAPTTELPTSRMPTKIASRQYQTPVAANATNSATAKIVPRTALARPVVRSPKNHATTMKAKNQSPAPQVVMSMMRSGTRFSLSEASRPKCCAFSMQFQQRAAGDHSEPLLQLSRPPTVAGQRSPRG